MFSFFFLCISVVSYHIVCRAVVVNWETFCLLGTVGNVCKHFQMPKLRIKGVVMLAKSGQRAKDVFQHLTMNQTSSSNK